MSERSGKLPVAVIAGVTMLVSAAAVFLINSFGGRSIGATWPVIGVAAGACLCFAYLELGLAVAGLFVLLLLSGIEVLAFAKGWPILLVWVAALVVFGYMRARKKTNPTT